MIPGRSKGNCRSRWLKTQNVKVNKSSWSEEEDIMLKKIVEIQGDKHWTAIAARFNEAFPDKERTRKQCRDRWRNYLNPIINKYVDSNIRAFSFLNNIIIYRAEITAQEEFHLFSYWRQLGNKWVEIAKLMGRAENWVKNNWKKVLKRESIPLDENIRANIERLLEKLQCTAKEEEKSSKTAHYDGSSQDLAEELPGSDTEQYPSSELISESGFSEYQQNNEPIRRLSDGLANPCERKPSDGIGRILPEMDEQDEPVVNSWYQSMDSCGEEVKEGHNTEECDFGVSMCEHGTGSQFMEDELMKYTMSSQEKSPFATTRHGLI